MPKPQTAAEKKAPTRKQAPTPSHVFVLNAPEAQEVFVVGDFNGWNPEGYKMRRFKGGVFKKSVKLKPGRYEYLFLVDGQWWSDPANPCRCANPFGHENSVVEIG